MQGGGARDERRTGGWRGSVGKDPRFCSGELLVTFEARPSAGGMSSGVSPMGSPGPTFPEVRSGGGPTVPANRTEPRRAAVPAGRRFARRSARAVRAALGWRGGRLRGGSRGGRLRGRSRGSLGAGSAASGGPRGSGPSSASSRLVLTPHLGGNRRAGAAQRRAGRPEPTFSATTPSGSCRGVSRGAKAAGKSVARACDMRVTSARREPLGGAEVGAVAPPRTR